MAAPIYILGHKNPDADAICSAIAYEAFKHKCGQPEYVAARCGNTNARIDAILNRFNVVLPKFIGDVTPNVGSIMQKKVRSLTRQNTCAEALEIIDRYDVRALPVIDSDGRLEGIISIFQLGEFFIPKPSEPRKMRRVNTSIDCILRSLNANVLHASNSSVVEELFVRVGAMNIESFGNYHGEEGTPAENSIIVVGDRRDIQEKCLSMGVRLLVITGGLHVCDEVIEEAKRKNVSLIVSPYDSASTSWIIRTATNIGGLISTDVHSFSAEDHIISVKRRIANLNDPLYFVTDEDKKVIGVFSKSDILRPSKTRIALVDHNELGQAVKGADQVQVTEIIDHHRIGNTATEQPILFINRPVGSTCSIIADLFRSNGHTPDSGIAGIMMAGIISDTLMLNSPTTTALEKELLDWLSPIAGIEAQELADIIFSSGSVILNHSPDEVVTSDCKVYVDSDVKYSVSQIEELGFDNFWKHEDDLSQALEAYRKKEDVLYSFLLVTDINSQDSLLVVAGDQEIFHQITYPATNQSNIYKLAGIVSRKKQLIPYISTLLKSMGVVA
jgi:manganese-dependent inorganic pyrophosphatase